MTEVRNYVKDKLSFYFIEAGDDTYMYKGDMMASL